MRVKINPIVHVIGNEELVIFPITRSNDFVLALNFYEDVPGGRLARLVLVHDRYGEIGFTETVIRGDKGVVEAQGVEEDFKKISEKIKIDRYLKSNRIPIFINIEVLSDADINQRGVKGYINYLRAYGNVNVSDLRDIIQLIIE